MQHTITIVISRTNTMVVTIVDMSVNFCVTAKRTWMEQTCPKL